MIVDISAAYIGEEQGRGILFAQGGGRLEGIDKRTLFVVKHTFKSQNSKKLNPRIYMRTFNVSFVR
jgi:hypothetical protein